MAYRASQNAVTDSTMAQGATPENENGLEGQPPISVDLEAVSK